MMHRRLIEAQAALREKFIEAGRTPDVVDGFLKSMTDLYAGYVSQGHSEDEAFEKTIKFLDKTILNNELSKGIPNGRHR